MRELLVDFTQEDPLAKGAEAGYIGENNATELVIKPGTKILNSGSLKFAVVFLSQGQIYRTDLFEPASEFRVMLGAHLTQDHYLSLQLEGYSEKNTLLYKSPMVTKIHFMPSIEGHESEIDPKDYQIYAQIALNAKSRHVHNNAQVINKLSAPDGELRYNNIPVCKTPKTKTVELSYDVGEFDASISVAGLTRVDFFSYLDIDSFIIPPDAEIVSIEFKFDKDEFPEWLDIRDIIDHDPDNPYLAFFHKTSTDSFLNSTVFCRLYFFNSPNKITNYISAFLLKKIRITYIENTVS